MRHPDVLGNQVVGVFAVDLQRHFDRSALVEVTAANPMRGIGRSRQPDGVLAVALDQFDGDRLDPGLAARCQPVEAVEQPAVGAVVDRTC